MKKKDIKKLTKDEIIVLPILLRGAAMRILLTRLHDQIYHAEGAFVKPKDPIEYYKILEFTKNGLSLDTSLSINQNSTPELVTINLSGYNLRTGFNLNG